ncbi:hypothetical protein E4U53_004389 [Claviceps sorghi]|nr:hypothetical protein E4U53_004389 [Claviceps sorghi]
MTADGNLAHGGLADGLALPSIPFPSHGCPSVSSPPLSIDGVFNVRDFGGHPVVMSASTAATTRPGIILRSAHLQHMTDEGLRQLRALRVARIFDLRGVEESRQYKVFVQEDKDEASGGGSGTGLPPRSALALETGDDGLSLRIDKYASVVDAESMAAHYLDMATSASGVHALQTILGHLLAHPRQPILVHCTLGKDRTGIVFALLLALAGVPDDAIAADYARTEQGLEPARAKMLSVIGRLCPDLAPRAVARKVDALQRCHAQCMLRFLCLLRERCGGATGYARRLCRLSESDLAALAEVLTVPS